MDLNELLDAHQRAVMQIADSGTADDELASRITRYAAQIRDMCDGYATGDLKGPIAVGTDAVIYAGRSGQDEMRISTAMLEIWESDGGALGPLADRLPEGVTMTLRPEYRVGPYVYSDIALALAEHERQRLAVDGSQAASPA